MFVDNLFHNSAHLKESFESWHSFECLMCNSIPYFAIHKGLFNLDQYSLHLIFYFEILCFINWPTHLNDKSILRFRRDAIEPSKEQMEKLGFPVFTVGDFYDTFLDSVDKLAEEGFNQQQLYDSFNEQGYSDYIVVFLRLLTSKYLQENAEFYQNFLDDNKTVKEFCSTDVEPMYQESDNIHITALTSATGINVRILYLDRGTNKEASPHDFPEGNPPVVHLLYRPGHYDILYPKSQ